jgi:hypothetical protein
VGGELFEQTREDLIVQFRAVRFLPHTVPMHYPQRLIPGHTHSFPRSRVGMPSATLRGCEFLAFRLEFHL